MGVGVEIHAAQPPSGALEEGEPVWHWPVTGASGCLEPPSPTASPSPTRPCTALTGGWGRGLRQEVIERLGPLCHPSCSRSVIALISENLRECSSGGMIWNCFFFGEN